MTHPVPPADDDRAADEAHGTDPRETRRGPEPARRAQPDALGGGRAPTTPGLADETAALRALALRVADEIARDERVQTILLTGSVARGEADAASDVDLMVGVSELPSPAEQEAAKQAALDSGGGIYGHDPEQGLTLYRFVEGVKVDVGLGRTADVEARVAALATEPDPADPIGPVVVTGILEGEALRGEERIADWKALLATPPEGYAEALVRHNLRFPPRALLAEMGVARGDLSLVAELLPGAAGRAQNVLFGLNGRWPTGKLKGLRRSVASLAIAPADAPARFDALWTAPPAEAIRVWDGLAAEILALVDAHMPAVSTREARERMAIPMRR